VGAWVVASKRRSFLITKKVKYTFQKLGRNLVAHVSMQESRTLHHQSPEGVAKSEFVLQGSTFKTGAC
jgi:hypothetical protein